MTQSSSNDSGYEAVLRLLAARTGLAFRANQRDATMQGIERTMDRLDVSNMHRFARLLEHDTAALDDLIVELTVGETYFFREPAQFEQIRGTIFPEIRRRRGVAHTLRIWSAGCASGEEPYSLAILCDQEGLGPLAHILATDISSDALAKAREGSYRKWSLRGESMAAAKDFLTLQDDRYQLHARICKQVQFEFLNLALDVYPSHVTGTMNMDLILCRNVLIYLGTKAIGDVARRLYDSLADGGWLITASGDPPLDDYANFETVVTNSGLFYRRPLIEKDVKETLPRIGQNLPSTISPERSSPRSTMKSPVRQANPALGSRLPEVTLRVDALAEAARLLEQGYYGRAAEVTEPWLTEVEACVLHVKAVANIDTRRAVQKGEEAAKLHPLSPELHYLHAVLLLEVNQDTEAADAARRAIFLDRRLAIAHFTLGSILQRRGNLDEARRHFRNARDLCQLVLPDEIVPYSEGETAGRLAAAAVVQLAAIDAALGRHE